MRKFIKQLASNLEAKISNNSSTLLSGNNMEIGMHYTRKHMRIQVTRPVKTKEIKQVNLHSTLLHLNLHNAIFKYTSYASQS